MAMLGSISPRFPKNHCSLAHRLQVGSVSKEWRVWYIKHLHLPRIIVLLSWELMLRNSKTELIFADISVLLQVEITRKVVYKTLLMTRELDAPGAHLPLIWILDPCLHHLIHMPMTAGDLSLAGGICLCLMHPSYSPLTKWIVGLTLQHSQVGNLRAGHGPHHRRGVTESSGRSSRTNWVRLSMFHDSSQPQRL